MAIFSWWRRTADHKKAPALTAKPTAEATRRRTSHAPSAGSSGSARNRSDDLLDPTDPLGLADPLGLLSPVGPFQNTLRASAEETSRAHTHHHPAPETSAHSHHVAPDATPQIQEPTHHAHTTHDTGISYTAPVETYTAPAETYTAPAETYTAPSTPDPTPSTTDTSYNP